MTDPYPQPLRRAGDGPYACPVCSGRIARTCRCGRAQGESLYAEEVIVVSMAEPGRAQPACASGGLARD